MRHLFYLFTLIVLLGCNQTSKKNNVAVKQDTVNKTNAITDSYPKMKVYTKEEQEIRRKEFDEEAKLDSIRLTKVLMKALNYAALNKSKSSFKFEKNSDDTSVNVTTQLLYGNLFSRNKKHLLVRRLGPSSVICNIFHLKNEKFKLVAEYVQEGLTYLEDTLKDVNGDSYKDYLVHWYPSSGCCRRNVYNVFLYLPETGQFTKDYEFINPTFSPKEKVIRGVQYGHPGEVALYKYKWNKLRVDTLEFIIPKSIEREQFYITQKSDWHRPPIVKKKLVNKIPKEYENIESIEWFLYD